MVENLESTQSIGKRMSNKDIIKMSVAVGVFSGLGALSGGRFSFRIPTEYTPAEVAKFALGGGFGSYAFLIFSPEVPKIFRKLLQKIHRGEHI